MLEASSGPSPRRLAAGGALAVAGALTAGACLRAAATVADGRLNRTVPGWRGAPSEEARRVHARVDVTDLHADALLWPRDLLRAHRRGHADLPRLLAGGVGLQVFSVVTKAPSSRVLSRGVPAEAFDPVTLLSVAAGRPARTWRSLLARALEQAARLDDLAARSGGLLRVARSAPDLDGSQRLSGLLAVEGLHCLEGDAGNVELLFEAGFRMFGLVHLADNDVAGSSTGVAGHGLTGLGREALERVEGLGGIVDLAHASRRTVDDVLEVATRPVVVSHTGLQATSGGSRNLSDEQVRGVAASGGVVGVGLWPEAVGAADPVATAKAVRHVVQLVGVEHVALGSDFDGTVATPFDASGWAHATAALLAEGFSEADVAAIMGGSARRLIAQSLPRA